MHEKDKNLRDKDGKNSEKLVKIQKKMSNSDKNGWNCKNWKVGQNYEKLVKVLKKLEEILKGWLEFPLPLSLWLGGHWWFLTKHLEDGVILDIMDRHNMWLYLCAKFSSLGWWEMCQEPPILEVHTWRMLMVPDLGLGGQGHSWHHG